MTEDREYAIDRWYFAGHAEARVSRCRACTMEEAVTKAERLVSLPGTTRVRISRRDQRGRFSAVRVWALRRHGGGRIPVPFTAPAIPRPEGENPGSNRSGEKNGFKKQLKGTAEAHALGGHPHVQRDEPSAKNEIL